MTRASLVLWLLLLAAAPAAAQLAEREEGTVRLGSLRLHPTIALLNLGIDDNVFNEAANPRSDQVFSLQPAVDLRFRVGRATIDGTGGLAYNYFRRYERERATNGAYDTRIELPFNRLTLRGSFGLTSTRERPGLEVDLRARRLVSAYGIGADLRLPPRMTLRVDASSNDTEFKSGLVEGVSLAQAFNRRSDVGTVAIRYALTPLTTLVLGAEALRDRFSESPSRDADGLRLMPGVEFNKFAVISGGAAIGFRRLEPANPAVAPYAGVAARVNLSSIIRGRARVGVQIDRDLAYSFTPDRPYYQQTTWTVSILQRLGARWDAGGMFGRQRLAYVDRVPLGPAAPPANASLPLESPDTLGAVYSLSLGYRLPRGLRASADWRQSARTTGRPDRDYTSRQYGVSLTYGF